MGAEPITLLLHLYSERKWLERAFEYEQEERDRDMRTVLVRRIAYVDRLIALTESKGELPTDS